MTYIPPQVTEREPDGTWEDCTWASGVMHANALRGATVVPGTRAEYEGLRVDGGDGPAEKPKDGSNLNQLRAGMLARYGIAGELTPNGAPWSTVRALLTENTTAVIQGKMGAFPAGHRLRRWDPAFVGGHAVHVVIEAGGPWWQNPLAPQDFQGETITWADLQAFYEALRPAGAACMVGRVGQYAVAAASPIVIADLAGATVALKTGSNVRRSPEIRPDNLISTTGPGIVWTLGRLVRGGVDPETGRNDWFQADLNGGVVGYTAAGNAAAGITPALPTPIEEPPAAPAPAPEPVTTPPAPEPTTQPYPSTAPPVGGGSVALPPPADGTPAEAPGLSDHDRELLERAGLLGLTREQVVERFSVSPPPDPETDQVS